MALYFNQHFQALLPLLYLISYNNLIFKNMVLTNLLLYHYLSNKITLFNFINNFYKLFFNVFICNFLHKIFTKFGSFLETNFIN